MLQFFHNEGYRGYRKQRIRNTYFFRQLIILFVINVHWEHICHIQEKSLGFFAKKKPFILYAVLYIHIFVRIWIWF